MKNAFTLTTFLLLLTTMSFSQMHIDRAIDLNSATPANARIMGIKQVSAAEDAVSAEVLQKGNLVYAVSAGGPNNYTLALSPAISTPYSNGMMLHFKANMTNAAGGVTLNAIPVKKDVGNSLAAGDIQLDQLVTVAYDGTNFQLLSRTADANSGGTVTTFSAGTLLPLFTTGVTNATTTPALSFTLSNAAGHTFFGNNTASATAPSFSAITNSDLPGSGTITVTPSGIGLSVGGSPVALGGTLTITSNATSANTVSTLVARDASGNFSAGTISAALNGNATSATNLANGAAGKIPYQSGAGTSTFTATAPGTTAGMYMRSTGTSNTWDASTIQLTDLPSGSKVVLNSITSYTANNTYTKPANLAYIIVEAWGGGGGGGGSPASCGSCTGNGGSGGAGGQTLFPTVSPIITANGGGGGTGLNIAPSCGGYTPGGTAGGAGGTASGGDINTSGASGGAGTNSSGCCMGAGGQGGGMAGGAAGVNGATGGNGGIASGGGGGATPVVNQSGAGAGGGGGYAMKKILASALAASVSFTVGAGGTAGPGGTFSCGGGPSPVAGVAGGSGGTGRIVIYEYINQ